MSRHRILVAVGTRPELIKLAPVIHELKRHPRTEPVVVFTAQHRELLDDMACFFGVHADLDLNAMRESQGLSELMSRLVVGLDRAIAESRPDLVLAQGDTTTVLSTALADVQLIEPLPYGEFVSLLQSASLVMTDSGGLQEEVPSLGIPLLVLRECTERPEGGAAGVAHLVGTDPDIILDHAVRALDGALLPADVRNPYGDGFAAKRVVHVILRSLTTRETSANAAA